MSTRSHLLWFVVSLFSIHDSVTTSPAFARTEAPKMMIDSDMIVSNVLSNSNMIASSVSDYGGYLFPVFGIGALAGLILFLAPPLADE